MELPLFLLSLLDLELDLESLPVVLPPLEPLLQLPLLLLLEPH
jgi:hypothetical protein